MGVGNTASSAQDATEGCCDAGTSGENVLVLGNSMADDADAYCIDRLSAPHGPIAPNLLLVSLDDTPDSRFDAVVRPGVGTPSNVGIVCCDRTRSAAAADPQHGPGFAPGPWITTVSSPGDLTGLGVRIGQALTTWTDDPGPIELCFHSLTTLLQYVDERAVFRLCHALTRHLETVGANSHFHLDPSAVDERTVAMLSALFDRVKDCT